MKELKAVAVLVPMFSVICQINEGVKLTVGKKYDVYSVMNDCYRVLDDGGELRYLEVSRFMRDGEVVGANDIIVAGDIEEQDVVDVITAQGVRNSGDGWGEEADEIVSEVHVEEDDTETETIYIRISNNPDDMECIEEIMNRVFVAEKYADDTEVAIDRHNDGEFDLCVMGDEYEEITKEEYEFAMKHNGGVFNAVSASHEVEGVEIEVGVQKIEEKAFDLNEREQGLLVKAVEQLLKQSIADVRACVVQEEWEDTKFFCDHVLTLEGLLAKIQSL